ncbi:MAG: hypothetical protein ABIR63_03125 [Sphingomicrobium sp.]
MSLRLIVLVLAGAASGGALAQSQPEPAAMQPASPAQAQGQTTPAPKPATIKKVICRRVVDEETTGSRVGSAPKVCKTIEVPAPRDGKGERG